MNRSIKPTLGLLLFLVITAQPPLCLADLYEDQLNLLKSQKEKAIMEVNRKYADLLQPLLQKVRANNNGSVVELKIRQELVSAGYPDKNDWIIGDWESQDSNGVTAGYTFYSDGRAAQLKLNGKPYGPLTGSYTNELNGSIKAICGANILIIEQFKDGFAHSMWLSGKDYPDKTKAITGIAKRVK